MTNPPTPLPGPCADWTVARACAEDAPALAALMSDPAVYPGTLQTPHGSTAFWRERLAAMDKPGADLMLAARQGDTLLGCAGLHPVGASPRRRHVMSLGLTVAGPAQGQGVGSALLAALLDHADHWVGVLRVELTVFADNARAIALYRRAGFEHEGTHRGYALREGRYVDCLAMARWHPRPPTLG